MTGAHAQQSFKRRRQDEEEHAYIQRIEASDLPTSAVYLGAMFEILFQICNQAGPLRF